MRIKSPEEIEKMRSAGKCAAAVLEMIEPYVVPGVSTGALERRCRDYIINDLHAIPSTLNHHGFPGCIVILMPLSTIFDSNRIASG